VLGSGITNVRIPTKPYIRGLLEFRLTSASFRRLGGRVVTVDVNIGVPPFVYPSKALLRRLIAKSPPTRAALVRDWRRQEFDHLRRELSPLEGETLWFRRAPIGLRLTLPARSVPQLFRLGHAESVHIRNIQGRRPVVEPRPKPRRLYAVRARLVYQTEGQTRGLQLCEDRVTIVRARSDKEATRRAERLLRMEEDPCLTTSGRFMRLALEEITDVIELIDDTVNDAGTEVYYQYRHRRVKGRWKPDA
jgi:uncharacterized protein DUF4288